MSKKEHSKWRGTVRPSRRFWAAQKAIADKLRATPSGKRICLTLPEDVWNAAVCEAYGNQKKARQLLTEVLINDYAAGEIDLDAAYEEFDPQDAWEIRSGHDNFRAWTGNVVLAPELKELGEDTAAAIVGTIQSISFGPGHFYGLVWINGIGPVTWQIEDQQPDFFESPVPYLRISPADTDIPF